jgi:hypothetical protein
VLATLGVGFARCQAILTAPSGSTLSMTANPEFIPAHGGVSVISVLVIEPTGTVVPDGTVVQFFTTLGRIDEQGRTNDGVARVNLLATGLSGPAAVTAVSGGEAAPPASSTTTPGSTTPGTTTTTLGPGQVRNPPLGAAQGVGSVSVTVAIGSALPSRIVLTADPVRITAQRASLIRAIVLDVNGNPVANVPVFFILPFPTATERLDLGGRPAFTDTNGVAEDVLRTTAAATAPPRVVIVGAIAPNGTTESVSVAVN